MKIYSIVLFSVMFVVSAAATETTVFTENFDGTNLSANGNRAKNSPRPGIEIVGEKAFSAPNALKVWPRPKGNVLLLFPDQLPVDRDIMIRFKVWINPKSNAYFAIRDRRRWSYMTINLKALYSPRVKRGGSDPWNSSYGIAPLSPDQWHELAICIGSGGKKYWLAQIDNTGKRIDGGTIYEFNYPNQIVGLNFQYAPMLLLRDSEKKVFGNIYFDDIKVVTLDPGSLQMHPVAESIVKKNRELELDLNATAGQKYFRKSREESEKKEKMKKQRSILKDSRGHFIKIQNQCERAVEINGIELFGDDNVLPVSEYNEYMKLPVVINGKETKEYRFPSSAGFIVPTIRLKGSNKQYYCAQDGLEGKTGIPIKNLNHIIIREKNSQSALRDFQVIFETIPLVVYHEETKEEIARNDAFRKAENDLLRLHMMLSKKSPWQKVILETVNFEKYVLKTGGEWEKFIARLAGLPPASFNSDDMSDDYKKESLLKALSAVSPHVSAEAQQNIRKLKGLLKKKDHADEFRRARDARFQRRAELQQESSQSDLAFDQAATNLFFLRVTSSKATSGWRKVILDSVSGDMLRNPTLKTSGEWEIFIARLAELPSGSFASDRIDDFDKERLLKSFSIVSPYVSENARNNIRKLKERFDQSDKNAGSGAAAKGLPPKPQPSPGTATSPGSMGMTDSQILSIHLRAPNMQLKMLLKRLRKKPEDTVFHQTIIAFMENKDGDSLKTKEEWEALVYTLNVLPKEAFSKVPIVEKSFLKSILSLIKHHVSSSAQNVISQLETRIQESIDSDYKRITH